MITIKKAEEGSNVPAAWTFSKSEFPIGKTVIEIFEEVVVKDPQAPAIRWNNEVWTYDMLNKRANMIAHFLRSEEYGVKKGDPVAFFMEQSASPIIAALAIAKAGGTYIPLDPSFQNSHVNFVLEDTGAKVIVCDESTFERCMQGTPHGVDFLHLDEDAESISSQPDTNPESCGVRPDSPFHIIYTSGSTGKPKGIEILHQGFVRLSLNTNWIKFTNKSKIASMANYAFDASSLEIWSSLLNGAEIIILPRSHALNPRSLKTFFLTHEITFMFITTQLFHFVAREMPDAFATLDQVCVGGEALSPEWAKAGKLFMLCRVLCCSFFL
jgi:non-ribosomal peptide synthetase component F